VGHVQPGGSIAEDMIATDRLILRQWTEADRAPYAAILADPEVMHDYGGPFTRAQADAKLDRYQESIVEFGFGKWAVERKSDRALIGHVGVSHIFPELPVYPGLEVGWRLAREAWGTGYAPEAAHAALLDVFARTKAAEVIAFTGPTNARSLAVMRHLGLERDGSRDYHHPNGTSGLSVVYTARRAAWLALVGREG
jgi:RimJ/RimL family protein N-acetyltransferase